MGKFLLGGDAKKIQKGFYKMGFWIGYIVISVTMFFVGLAVGQNEGKSSVGYAILFSLGWPIAAIYLFLSLFYGVGKYL